MCSYRTQDGINNLESYETEKSKQNETELLRSMGLIKIRENYDEKGWIDNSNKEETKKKKPIITFNKVKTDYSLSEVDPNNKDEVVVNISAIEIDKNELSIYEEQKGTDNELLNNNKTQDDYCSRGAQNLIKVVIVFLVILIISVYIIVTQ